MFEITVNNRVIDAEEGETILSALTRVGIRVPTLCHLPDLPPVGACRICIVEVEGAEGDGLVPSCSYPVAEGMRISQIREKSSMPAELCWSFFFPIIRTIVFTVRKAATAVCVRSRRNTASASARRANGSGRNCAT